MSYLYWLGAANGLVLAGLLFFKTKGFGANIVMAFWCLLLSLNFLGSFVYIDQEVNAFSFLIGWTYYLPAAYGGLLYLYCKKLIDHSKFVLGDTVHLLPLLLCYALNIDILLASSELKLSYILDSPPLTPSFYLSQFILYAQAIVYAFLSLYVLFKYKHSYKEQFSTIKQDISKWLSLLISLSLIIWLFKLSASLFEGMYWLSMLGSVLIVVFIYLIGFFQWVKPALFELAHLVDIAEQKSLPAHSKIELDIDDQNKHAKQLSLDVTTHKVFAEALEEAVKNERLYLQENLSLAQLSAHTGMSIHHISETLNQYIGKNFYRFINEFRVEHFCNELATNPQQKILDVAMQSGFANKSTFNLAFKEIKQMTPSQYRAQVNNTVVKSPPP